MKLKTIFNHEFKVFALNKTFLILTLIGPFLIIAITVLPSVLTMNMSEKINISIYCENDKLVGQLAGILSNLMHIYDIEMVKNMLTDKKYISESYNLQKMEDISICLI